MELRWLQDFLAVAETGNFTRAAAIRNTSQAAFSRRIQQLEAWLGVALIDRSILPTQLTRAGEDFRVTASRMLSDALQVRTEMNGYGANPPAELLRLGMPYALATTRFPDWWQHWTRSQTLSATVVVGNVHDLGLGLLSGATDLMVAFQATHRPLLGELDRVELIEIEQDRLRPYASRALVDGKRIALPASADMATPLLMYSRGIYFARLVDMIIQRAGGISGGTTIIENDMSDVLARLAEAGQGLAWLPDSTVKGRYEQTLAPVGGPAWTMPISIVALRDRTNVNPALSRLWTSLQNEAGTTHAAS